MKSSAILTALLASSALSQAAITYYQDFSATPTDASGAINPILFDTLYDGTGQNITGGSSATQSTDGDYTINLGRATTAASGNGFIFTTGDGFSALDQDYTFTTGTTSVDNQGSIVAGTVFINATSFNVGDEFLNLQYIQIEENDATGEVTLTIDYEAYGDFAGGGNEGIYLTTNFGLASDLTGVNIAPVNLVNDASLDETYTYTLVAAVPEPSSTALLGLGGIALILRRRR
ncbi:PEP-CTERM sorting domain-containing protein [Rubritalea sp.]|uniref:PEP-CTERM sorting domain-containing protein n=1 Tax=Rubritalea sp. TaxID=2109375 RepID=UPI003EF6570C